MILQYAQRIQAIAQSGLAFTTDYYDRERYEELATIACELMALSTTGSVADFQTFYSQESGYATPKIDVRAVITNKEQQLLLVKDRGSGQWSLPGGYADVGLSASENIVKEVFEETGLLTSVERLLAIYDTNKSNPANLPIQYYKLVFGCQVLSGKLQTSFETTELAYFNRDDLPVLSERRNTYKQLSECLELKDTQIIID